jgi:squamous cell carcinoma antigen recognized by T-cells 3
MEVRERSVRVRNLPAGTQEGLLQQVLAKHAQIQRVEVFQDSNEAIAELENPAVRLVPSTTCFHYAHYHDRT